MPLSNSVIANDVRNLSMKLSRALTTMAEGGSLEEAKSKSLTKQELRDKKKREKREKKKGKKAVVVKRSAKANTNEDGIPMWLTDEAQKTKSRQRV